MSKSIEQQAADAAQSVLNNLLTVRHAGQTAAGAIAAALSRAGLLVSERDVLCRNLADCLGKMNDSLGQGSYIHISGGKTTVTFVDNTAALAFQDAISILRKWNREHAPKPAWLAVGCSLENTRNGFVYAMPTPAEAEAAAKSMNAALNALAEKEAGRV